MTSPNHLMVLCDGRTEAPRADAWEDLVLRDQLSSLRSLLTLTTVMVQFGDERQILDMAVTTVPSLGRCRPVGVFIDSIWRSASPEFRPSSARMVAQLQRLPHMGGAVEVAGFDWAWAYPVQSLEVSAYLVVTAAEPPSSNEQFLLRTLAQQAAVALANARLHARERATAEELAVAKEALEESMGALQRGVDIHRRLTQVAMAGEGQEGIARALHEVTRYPVAIEDRFGNLRAWAGSDCPDPYPKDPPQRREQLIRRALGNPQPFRHEGRLLTLARPREDVLGVLALIDPGNTAGAQELVALEHGGTVLAMELARLQSLAETELRLRRDLVEELLAGTDEESARRRAQALGYDLERTHRVVVVEGYARSDDENLFFHAVRRAARDVGVGTLVTARAKTVIILSDAEPSWDKLRAAIVAELSGGSCRIGIGGRCEGPSDFLRSYQEAQLALKMQRTSRGRDKVTVFDDLGVYQVLFEVQDPTMERFIRRWLGPLLDYDLNRGTELVATLAEYLEHGRNYDTTAAALCVHRSTLKYRLQRIREICGCDLRDPDAHFNLQLACRAWRTLEALRQPLEDIVAEARFSRFRSGFSDCLS